MRKVALVLALVPLLRVSALAKADQFGGFARFADSGSLKPFARDLGGILGAATFHGGRSLGFSGFDVGVRFGGQFRPSAGDTIMRNEGVHFYGLPWVQAEIGLPFKIDGFIRGVSYHGLTISGGGLRYGLYSKSDQPWSPQVLVSGVGHSVVHRDFSASHFGANLVASAGNAVVTPYAGVGFDRTRLVVRQSSLDPTLNGSVVETFESRFTLGARVKPYQFTYVSLAATFAHGIPGAEAGLGLRF